ncbi:Dephospho-CoA kinase, partial [mine drainage metagenome]
MAMSSDQSDVPDPAYPMPIIGIVGGIGSGKSLVAAELQRAGCFVIDSDSLAHRALDEPVISRQLQKWFGSEIIGTFGKIDRRKLGAVVFRNPVNIQRLNSLVHPR